LDTKSKNAIYSAAYGKTLREAKRNKPEDEETGLPNRADRFFVYWVRGSANQGPTEHKRSQARFLALPLPSPPLPSPPLPSPPGEARKLAREAGKAALRKGEAANAE
jgi:hypothetical protein